MPEPESFCTKEVRPSLSLWTFLYRLADLRGPHVPLQDVAFIISEFRQLKPREGAAEMIQILRDGGFEVRCCSDANVERLKGYFDAAKIHMPIEHIYSADEVSP